MLWRPEIYDALFEYFAVPQIGDPLTPDEAMELALRIALQGTGFVSPNPLVGAVVVDARHRFLGAGAHLKCGDRHAEVNAIDSVLEAGLEASLKGATVYVTLEPCAHHGRTPPCADMLRRYPLREVVYAVPDRTPKVNGQGLRRIREAGILTRHAAEFEGQGQRLAEVFLHAQANPTPFVAMALSAEAAGQVIFPAAVGLARLQKRARSCLDYLHLRYDAVMIDAPSLLSVVRSGERQPGGHPLCGPVKRLPWTVVVDPTGLLARQEGGRLLAEGLEKVVWVTNETSMRAWSTHDHAGAFEARGGRVLTARFEDGLAPMLPGLMSHLHGMNLHGVLVEGAEALASAMLETSMVRRVHLFQDAATGSEAIATGAVRIGGRMFPLSSLEISPLGERVLLEGVVSRPPEAAK